MERNDNRQESERPQGLSSAEYRARLLTKLNCLIAVLEVAIAKITRSMDVPGANEDRLVRIRVNLENTLSICNRARQTLEKGSVEATQSTTQSLPATLDGRRKMTYRDYVELSSIDEYRKFRTLAPIQPEDIAAADIDGLVARLLEP